VEKVIHYGKDVIVEGKHGDCVFLKNHRCVIYDNRPDVCRKFGVISQLKCPYLRPDGTKRCRQETRRIQREITKSNEKKIKFIKEYAEAMGLNG